MMNRAKTFLLILGIAVIGGCASHGKNIQSAFGREDVNTETMRTKMKWLEPVVAEGKTHEQFRVVKSLRYVSKYNPDLEKRKLAVRGLLFVSVFSDDSDVRSSAQSRLITILNDRNEDLALRFEVIDGKKDIVIGQTFYEKNDPSLFTDQVEKKPVYPDEDDREAALLFLIDHFEDLEIDLQQHLVTAFGQIMVNPQICLEPSEDGCEEYDGEDQDEWKKTLGRQINYWVMNRCDWDREVIPQETKDSLRTLMTDNPDLISMDPPDCSPYHPVAEDFSVLKMRSIKIPASYVQFGLDLSEASSKGLHASSLEFGFGNGKTFGVMFGVNIDEQWMEPLREKYFIIQYRVKNHKSAIGATRVIRTPDFSLVEQRDNDVDGAIDGESAYTYSVDENEVYFTSAFDIDRISSHLHLYLGSISQKIALQYFFRKPDISFILEGSARSNMKVKDRETDTVANEDKAERESLASKTRSDILLGAKWNNISLLRGLFSGSKGRAARQGIFDFKLYYSVQGEKTYFVVTSPF
ncbi:MAG: hypothetical protein HN580_22870 [Deltaproteobacteria bacterium]|nr:hypothetical protein [Deltaproteobacteria bacterium]